MVTGSEDGQRYSRSKKDGPCEHPALDSGPGYWPGRWLEFKRLFSLSWNNGYNKPVVIVTSVLFVGMTLWGIAMRVWEMLFG